MTLDRAKSDWKRILNKGGFQVDLTFESPSSFIAIVKGWGQKHHQSYDENGLPISSKNVQVTVAESELTDLNYQVRNSNDEVDLLQHNVTFKDARGVEKKYKIVNQQPDEYIGIIVLTCNDHV
jgi:hypothetical protein